MKHKFVYKKQILDRLKEYKDNSPYQLDPEESIEFSGAICGIFAMVDSIRDNKLAERLKVALSHWKPEYLDDYLDIVEIKPKPIELKSNEGKVKIVKIRDLTEYLIDVFALNAMAFAGQSEQKVLKIPVNGELTETARRGMELVIQNWEEVSNTEGDDYPVLHEYHINGMLNYLNFRGKLESGLYLIELD